MRKIMSWIAWWVVYMVLACLAVTGALNVANEIKDLIDPDDYE